MTNVETDPLFQLLTDALRAGPGSPEWHQAVMQLRDRGAAGEDEYRLLLTARENLASGKEYRSVRAGPGFTRRLYERIEQEPAYIGRARGLPVATIIAALCGVVLLAIVGIGIWLAIANMRNTPSTTPSTAIKELDEAYFASEVASGDFADSIPMGWRTIGQLSLEAGKQGLVPDLSSAPAGQTVGGAVLTPESLPADVPFEADIKLRLNKPSDAVIVQAFISADPPVDFSLDRATSAHELVWLMQGKRQKVVLGEARQQAEAPRPRLGKKGAAAHDDSSNDTFTVRIKINKEVAIVDSDGQRLWAGAHGLPPGPRTVGVRFLHVGSQGKSHEPASVESVVVLKK